MVGIYPLNVAQNQWGRFRAFPPDRDRFLPQIFYYITLRDGNSWNLGINWAFAGLFWVGGEN